MENLLVPIAFFTILIPCDVINTKSYHDCTRDIKSHTNNKHGNYDNYMHRSPWHCSCKTMCIQEYVWQYQWSHLSWTMLCKKLSDTQCYFAKKKKEKLHIHIVFIIIIFQLYLKWIQNPIIIIFQPYLKWIQRLLPPKPVVATQ